MECRQLLQKIGLWRTEKAEKSAEAGMAERSAGAGMAEKAGKSAGAEMAEKVGKSAEAEKSARAGITGGAKLHAITAEKDAGNRGMERKAKGVNSKTGKAAGVFQAAKAKAGGWKATRARDFKIIRGVRLAAILIDLTVIAVAVLDRIAETQLPENEACRGKAFQWMLRRLLPKRGRRRRNAA